MRTVAVPVLAVWVAASAGPAWPQTAYGSITGLVRDPSNAVVPDARVAVTNLATQERRVQPTGADGLYVFVNLIPGRYRLDVEKTGFRRFIQPEVAVEVGQTARVDVVLMVGEVTEEVQVTAETPLLQHETTSLGQVVDQRKANELPLNGRNIFNLITLSPAVIPQNQSTDTPVGKNPFGWGNYQVNGSFANQSAEYLDGQPLNIGYINLPVLIPTQDSVQEFKVQTSNLGAEWGRYSGGVINITTKSGTNTVHGSAYEFLRNQKLNANDFFLNAAGRKRPPWVQNQYGANAGGPVFLPGAYDGRNKSFWFFSWESFRLRTATPFTTTVPTDAMKSGDFSALKTPLTDPCGGSVNAQGLCASANPTPTRFSGNIIPANRINPTSRALLNLFPAPNASGTVDPVTGIVRNNFVTAASSGGNQDQVVVRGDQNLGANHRLFGRYSYWKLTDLPIDPLGTGLCADRCAEVYHTHAVALGYNWTLSPTTILSVNSSVSRFRYNRTPTNAGFDLTRIGWPATFNDVIPAVMRTPPTPCIQDFADDIVCSQGQSFIQDRNTQYNISPSLTFIKGRHTFQTGAQFLLSYDNYAQTNVASGAFSFCIPGAQCFSGNGFADFLLGFANNPTNAFNHFFGQAIVPALTAGKQFYRAFYFGDTWRVSDKLTLNLGLRYELQGPWSERFNRLSFFDPNSPSFLDRLAGVSVKGDVFLVEPDNGHNVRTEKRNFSPRVGLAYTLDAKTVIRTAYGINWIPNFVSFALNPLNDQINAAATSFTGTIDGRVPIRTIANPFPGGIAPPPGRGLGPLGTQLFYTQVVQSLVIADRSDAHKKGYVQQWNFNVQRELPGSWFISAAYVGSKGTHLPAFSQQINQIPNEFLDRAAAGQLDLTASVPNPFFVNGQALALTGPTTTVGQLLRPFPQYTGVQLAGQGSFDSIYHSFQLTAERRFAGAGSILVAYTASKLISNTDTLTSWLDATGGIQDNNNLRKERSLSSQDVPQRLVISYVLDLPFGRGKRFLSGVSGWRDKVVSGWGVNGVTVLQSGFPLLFTSAVPNDATLFGAGPIRPNVVPGCNFSARQGNRLSQAFNTACFTAPPNFTFGNAPRVDPRLRSDRIENFDFAVFKRTRFGPEERLGLEFRTEFFNIFNRARFNAPNTTLGSANFGVINSTAPGSNPRLIQFAVRLMF